MEVNQVTESYNQKEEKEMEKVIAMLNELKDSIKDIRVLA